MKKKSLAVLIICTMVICLAASCGRQQSEKVVSSGEDKEGIRIGITFDTFVLERWTRDRDVFVSTAQKLGAKVDVQNANGDVEKQKKQIERFIEEKVDTIVIVAVDCFALEEEVTKARNFGINVISYDRLIQGVTTDLYVTVDNEQVGQEMAREIIEELPDGGKVVMICGPEADTNSLDVVAGFEEGISGSQLEVVSKRYVKSWTPENGFQAVNEAFQSVKEFDAVMCGNDGLAGYAIKALSEQQLAGKVVVVGQDADLEACQRIVEGTQDMTVYKPIEELARIAAECAVKFAKAEPVVGGVVDRTTTKKIDTGEDVPYYGLTPVAVTAENMDEVIVKPGFHPKDEVYLNVENKQEETAQEEQAIE